MVFKEFESKFHSLVDWIESLYLICRQRRNSSKMFGPNNYLKGNGMKVLPTKYVLHRRVIIETKS